MSLAINGSEAMPNGGALKISTSIVSLDDAYCKSHLEAKPGAYVMLSVRDTGCGMDKETLTRIFDPFFPQKKGALQGEPDSGFLWCGGSCSSKAAMLPVRVSQAKEPNLRFTSRP